MSDDTKGVGEIARTETPSWVESIRAVLSDDVDDPVDDDWDE